MRYQGGKKRISRKIADCLLDIADDVEENTGKRYGTYVEPFVGMGSVLARVIELTEDDDRPCFDEFHASDISPDVITFWKAAQRGWDPPRKVSKDEWTRLRDSSKPSAERTFAGYGGSWGGQFFGGYAKSPAGRDLIDEARRAVLSVAPLMGDVHFSRNDYTDLKPRNSFVYADPPYKGTTGYELLCRKSKSGKTNHRDSYGELCDGFDTDLFWDTMRDWSRDNVVVVSELTAPDDWVVWKEFDPISRSLGRQSKGQSGKKAVEKLFIHESWMR